MIDKRTLAGSGLTSQKPLQRCVAVPEIIKLMEIIAETLRRSQKSWALAW